MFGFVPSNNMNKNIIIAIIILLAITALVYFIYPRPDELSPEDRISSVVETYIYSTLGTLPSSDVDYDKAKALLSPGLREKFQDPSFVPQSYCIQDGPGLIGISSIDIGNSSEAKVVVKGRYEEWQEMWEFKLMSTEKGNWLIDEINCLHIQMSPQEVTKEFILSTLGTLPEAEINYELARSLMTSSYTEEFDSPAFIPNAYGIQEGPTSVEFESEDITGEEAEVIVIGHWGEDLQMHWKFEMKQEQGEWKVNFINPGQ